MALGLYLLSRMDAATPTGRRRSTCSCSVSGIGLSMQVLTIIVQNTVPYGDLGVATSGVTFLRTLGSSFGAAIFGTLYSNFLDRELPGALAQAPGVTPADLATPSSSTSWTTRSSRRSWTPTRPPSATCSCGRCRWP